MAIYSTRAQMYALHKRVAIHARYVLRHLTPARSGVGSASPPARPTLDGYVPRSFLDCGHAELEVAAPEPRRGRAAERSAGR